MATKIDWTEQTWNPVTGCTKVSAGYRNCYAEAWAKRLKAMGTKGYERGFDVTCHPDRLGQPMGWTRKPRMVFVGSMSDLFHLDVPAEFIFRIWAAMGMAPKHTFQVLTKRPQRMLDLLCDEYAEAYLEGSADAIMDSIDPEQRGIPSSFIDLPLRNVWCGVSIEDNESAWRADILREVPAAVRFLSIEPLIGPVDAVDVTGMNWCIVGCESGPKRRPCRMEWMQDLAVRCRAAGVPFFCKQIDGGKKVLHHRGGDWLGAWPESLRSREYPRAAQPANR